jgi:hypothetical protein
LLPVTCGTNANTMLPYPLRVQHFTHTASSFLPAIATLLYRFRSFLVATRTEEQ